MYVITRSLMGCLIVAGLTIFIAGSCQATSDIRQIDTSVLQSMMAQNKEIFLINVLPKIIHDAKHIPGSLNIPLGQIRDTNALPEKLDSPLVFYCMGNFESKAPRSPVWRSTKGTPTFMFTAKASWDGCVQATQYLLPRITLTFQFP